MYEIATDLHRSGFPIQLRFAVEPDPFEDLILIASGLAWHWDLEQSGLSAVARDALVLVEPGDAALKWCANPTCTHPFLDRSRGHRRRYLTFRLSARAQLRGGDNVPRHDTRA